jgi:hypothetical protein
MPSRSLTIDVQDALLKRIRARARRAKRSVEAEVVDLLAGAVNGVPIIPSTKESQAKTSKNGDSDNDEELAPDIVEEMDSVRHLDDDSLRKALTPIMTKKQAKRLADLNYKAQDERLTPGEKIEQEELLHVAEKSMVVRAAVLAELHKRGVDVSEYVAP